MNFEPVVEHGLLRESVRHFFERELPEARIREMDRARRIPRSLWKRFGAMGWMGLSVPAEFGGSGADVATAAVFCEELARRFPSLATDWLLVSMTARVLREFARPALKADLLPKLAAGDFLMAFGMSEPDGGTDVLALKTRALLEGGEWVVRGQKLYTSLADDADAILVLCRTDPAEGKRSRGLSLILTPRNQQAVQVRRLELMGMRAACTCEVFLDGARAPVDAVIGERGDGWRALLRTLDEERILCAALYVGITSAALEQALQYARDRHAFGRPIGAFQAVQHPLADIADRAGANPADHRQGRLVAIARPRLRGRGRHGEARGKRDRRARHRPLDARSGRLRYGRRIATRTTVPRLAARSFQPDLE